MKILKSKYLTTQTIEVTAVISILAAIVWFLSIRIGSFLDYPPKVYQDPDVFNLTSSKVEWDVFYGSSPKCGDIDCHLTADYPASNFTKKMVLPAREFPLNGYKVGQTIYVRTSVVLPPQLSRNDPIVIYTPIIFAKHYWLYLNGRLVEDGDQESLLASIPSDLIGKDNKLFIAFRIDPGNLSFQGLSNRSDLVIGAKEKLRPMVFMSQDLSSNLFLWFLLPRITFCAMFGFLFITTSRTKDIFSFVMYAFLGAMELFFRSDYAPSMLPGDLKWNFLGMLCRNFSVFAFIGFVYYYFRLGSSRFNRILAILVSTQFVFGILSLTVIPYKIADTITDCIIVVLKPAAMFYAASISVQAYIHLRKTKESQNRMHSAFMLSLVFIFWLIVAMFESGDNIRDMLGYNAGGLLRKTWIVDLAFFFVLAALTAIEIGTSFASKRATEAELKTLEERLELGRSVQNLLLPPSLDGGIFDAKFRFYYDPAQKMSGDWLNMWKSEDGRYQFLIGDVVGKGPQAALAVAAIASTISECRDEKLDLEQSIMRLNHRLLNLFHGSVSTTLTAASIDPELNVELYNCGALGWLMFLDSKWDYVPLRAASLGTNVNLSLSSKKFKLEAGSGLLAFTDGCLEGSRALKSLIKQFSQNNTKPSAHAQIHGEVIAVGAASVIEDDKTLLVISA